MPQVFIGTSCGISWHLRCVAITLSVGTLLSKSIRIQYRKKISDFVVFR